MTKLDPLQVFTGTTRHNSAAFWGAAVRLQLSRVEEMQAVVLENMKAVDIGEVPRRTWLLDGVAFFHAQSADIHFLLISMRNVLRLAVRVGVHSPEIAAALSAFNEDFADVPDLRDMLEHLGEYALGEGLLQRRGQIDTNNRGPHVLYHSTTDPTAEIEIRFGAERRVPLKAAAARVAALADRLDADEVASSN